VRSGWDWEGFTFGNALAGGQMIVISPSFGEGLFVGMYCLTCICYAGSSGEDVINSSRMCWHGTICSFTIKFASLIAGVGSFTGSS
jgi:hypothetical protein